MKSFSWSQFLLTCVFYVFFSSLLLISFNGFLWAGEQNPFMKITKSGTGATTYFILVDAQVIDAELLDDQTLEKVSPALIDPLPVRISRNEYDQIIRQEYNNAICFKRCHSSNDFSASDNTKNQWHLLIEKDGHAVFNTIPWENSQTKEKIVMYLLNNAGNSGPETEGIGVWH